MHFIKSTRNNAPSYSFHEGMDFETIKRLLSELGCTDIVEISQDEYNTATQTI